MTNNNRLDIYDTNSLKDALKLIVKAYEYNYKSNDSLTNRLETIITKLEMVIDDYGGQD